jgi:hypothetical protein
VYGNYEENYNITDPLDVSLDIQTESLGDGCDSDRYYEINNTTSNDITYQYLLCDETSTPLGCYTYSVQNDNLSQSATFRYTDCNGVLFEDVVVLADSSTPDFCAQPGSVSRQGGAQIVINEENTSCVSYREGVAKPGINYICASQIVSQAGLTITDEGNCGGQYGTIKTLKSNRNYVVGLVYFDSNGRKSSVIADENKFINVPFGNNDLSNRLKVTINNFAPSWADRYKIAIKEIERDYVTLKTLGDIWFKSETNSSGTVSYSYLYVRIDEKEKNKVPDGSKVIAKSLGTTSFNNIDTYEVESVASYDTGDVGTSSDAGLYVKLRGEGRLKDLARINYTAASSPLSGYATFEVVSETEQESIFYETPGTYNILNGFHEGTQQDQTEIYPAIVQCEAFNAFAFGYGVESNRIKDDITLNTFNLGVRVNETVDLFKRNKRIASLTYSDVYEESTGYDGLNVFNLSQVNYKDIDEKYGEIRKIHSRDNDLIVFQENKVHRVLFNKNVLFTASGTGDVSQTLSVLGQEVPYVGEYGISSSPASFSSWGSRIYFADETRSEVLRISQDGISVISGYGMRSWFNDNLSRNLNIKSVGGYDPINGQYVLSIQDISVEWKEDTFSCDTQESTPTTTTTSTTTSTTTTTAAPTTTTTTAAGTTTTTEPGPTTTTTQAPCVPRITSSSIPAQTLTQGQTVTIDLSTNNYFTQLDGLSLSYSVNASQAINFYGLLSSATINGSILTMVANNNNICSPPTSLVQVTADDGVSGNCIGVESIGITVTGCGTTTTTTTQAPATTTTTTQAPATTTTTAAPAHTRWNLVTCPDGSSTSESIGYNDAGISWSIGDVVLADNGVCYEISFSSTGTPTLAGVSFFNNCTECGGSGGGGP